MEIVFAPSGQNLQVCIQMSVEFTWYAMSIYIIVSMITSHDFEHETIGAEFQGPGWSFAVAVAAYSQRGVWTH